MIELSPGEATLAIRALFPAAGHAYRRCFAALDGTAAGRILTDDPLAPSWAAVYAHSDDGTLFLAGSLHPDLVAAVIHDLRREFVVCVGLTPDAPLLALLPPDPDYDG